MLSRGVCGIAGRTLIVNFPGSPKAIHQLFGVIEPVLGHAEALLSREPGQDVHGPAGAG
jgi:molybdopterin biosynthesis enzyme MoaB